MRNKSKASTRKIAAAKKTTTKPTVRNQAKVTVKRAVNGIAPAKKASAGVRRGTRTSNVKVDRFPKELLSEVQTKLRTNERLVVLSPTEAHTVYVKD